jgi:hypothetical protein
MQKYIIHQMNSSKHQVFNRDKAIKYKGRKGRSAADCEEP